jgi:hypothetical protein
LDSGAYRTDGSFATVWHAKKTGNLRLTVEQQQRFVEIDRSSSRKEEKS